jgi:hypothetical protein
MREIYRFAYLPAAEYAAARERKLLDATMPHTHVDYRRMCQEAMRETASNRPGGRVYVVPLDVTGLLQYAEREGKDPASRQTRMDYNNSLVGDGREVGWPPERNAPCWCGSGRKYKKCCGAPEFLAVEVPDQASFVLRVELDGVRPAVWRRVAAPSRITLDRLHLLIQDAMGWDDQHLYAFETDEGTFVEAPSSYGDYPAFDERLVAVANEPGHHFHYTYDFGDDWSHTVTVEEVREAGPENVPRVLDGAGACPPEDCGGVPGYLALLRALTDPADPDHDDAVERLGAGYDPARYRSPGTS